MTMTAIKNHDVQSVNISASPEKVFDYIAKPENLPNWTRAFKKADQKSALLITPEGELQIDLETRVDANSGTIDWYMTMPDGTVGTAFSRVTEDGDGQAIYSFVLMAPPVPLEMVEGALSAQIGQLADELKKLQQILN